MFDTLAAAYAEAGRFDEVILTCEKASELVDAAKVEKEAARYREYLVRFQSGQTLHSK